MELEREENFDEVVTRNNVVGLRIAAALGFTFLPGFAILDYVLAPDAYGTLWIFRTAATIVSIVIFGLTFTSWGLNRVGPLSSIVVISVGISFALMIRYLGGYASPYYAGLCLLILASGFLFTWRLPQSVFTTAAIVGTFEIPALFLDKLDNVAVFVNNSFFLCTTGVVVVIGQTFNYRLKYREFRNAQLVLEAKQEIEHAHEQLKEAEAFRSQFFANITHELKTPLAMIVTPIDLLLQKEVGQLTDAQIGVLKAMRQSGLKLLKMVGDLLDLSRLEDSRLRLEIGKHDLVDYVKGVVAQIEPMAKRKNLELTLVCQVDSAEVECDLNRMDRVLLNLITNAIKFTPESGKVSVTLRDLGETIEVSVADNGVGFKPEFADRVFERFFQVDMSDTRQHGGSGIGLALAKDIVELHGGHISAQSQIGKGATFTFVIPKKQPTDPDWEKQADAQKKEPEEINWSYAVEGSDQYRLLDVNEATERRLVERHADDTLRKYTILVVEDTPEVIRVIHLALNRYARIIAAGDGLKGFEMAVKEQPNLIITDLMMPGIDGFELTQRLRADTRTRHTPIVMLTARGELDNRIKGAESGVNAYLTKPFVPKELVSTVQSMLDLQEVTAEILLDQRVESLQAITGGLAHEINNPLNYIKNSLVVVSKDVKKLTGLYQEANGQEPSRELQAKCQRIEDRLQRMFQSAEAGVARIAKTVDLMSSYSRNGHDNVAQNYDAYTAAKEVIQMVLPTTGRDVKLETSFEGDGQTNCVPEQLNQVLTNIIQNAIEAVPDETGVVNVQGRTDKGKLVLTIADNGPGIPEEDRKRIFTPFYTTKGPGAGQGMGLTICWRAIKAMNGNIQVEENPGGGARFVVTLNSSAESQTAL